MWCFIRISSLLTFGELRLISFAPSCSGETDAAAKVASVCVEEACFYNKGRGSGCHRVAVQRVWMRGKRSSPKERRVCAVCLLWLTENEIADRYVSVSTGPGLPTKS